MNFVFWSYHIYLKQKIQLIPPVFESYFYPNYMQSFMNIKFHNRNHLYNAKQCMKTTMAEFSLASALKMHLLNFFEVLNIAFRNRHVALSNGAGIQKHQFWLKFEP